MALPVLAVAVALLLVSIWVVFYHLLKQQGRILLALDQIRQAIGVPAGAQPQSLPVGTEFPSFALPDLSGNEVKLEDFRGKSTLLVNWSPNCGFCDRIAPALAEVASSQDKLQIILLARGDEKANRDTAEEHRLKCPIQIVQDSDVPAPFKEFGTPVAYLLDAEGRVASPMAVGAEQVPELARAAAGLGTKPVAAGRALPGKRPLSDSRIEREGLKTGAPAPLFSLPDVSVQPSRCLWSRRLARKVSRQASVARIQRSELRAMRRACCEAC